MVILSVAEAAKFLAKTPAALRNGYKRWGVPHFRLGGQIKFTQEALQEWVNKNMVGGEATAESRTLRSDDGRTRDARAAKTARQHL